MTKDIVAGADNRLVILTDSYLDFEDNPNVVTKKHRSTSTDFTRYLSRTSDWKTTMEQGDWGLLPANVKLSNVCVSVVETSPKSLDLDEAPILQEVWRKWLNEMQARQVIWIPKFSLENSKTQLQKFLEG